MAFDLATAMRVSGNTPDMYENQQQAMQDLQAQAQSDPGFRQQMVTQRARDWYQGYMGKPAPQMPGQAPEVMQPQAMQPQQGNPADSIRNLILQLRQFGVLR